MPSLDLTVVARHSCSLLEGRAAHWRLLWPDRRGRWETLCEPLLRAVCGIREDRNQRAKATQLHSRQQVQDEIIELVSPAVPT